MNRTGRDGVRRRDRGWRAGGPRVRDPPEAAEAGPQRLRAREGARAFGAHSLSGAVIEPGPIDALLPGWRDELPGHLRAGGPRRVQLPDADRSASELPTPPQMNNHGNFIVSLGNLVALLGARPRRSACDVFAGFAAAAPLFDEQRRGRGRAASATWASTRTASRAPNFAPGPEIRAKTHDRSPKAAAAACPRC